MAKDGTAFRTKKAGSFSLERLLRRDFIFQPSTFFRKRAFEAVGLLDERYQSCIDYGCWLRLAKNGAIFVYEQSNLSWMRFHDDAKSVKAILLSLDEEKALKLEYGCPYLKVQFNSLSQKIY